MSGKAVFQGGNAQSLDNIAGQPIAKYTHSKSGTVHKLEGPVNAKNIVFKATGDYNDGDTWTLNDSPVTVTYNGGEALLPTAVLTDDMVQAVVMEDQLRLMLQTPTPQENLIENGQFVNPINQRGKTDYTTVGYTIDRWRLDSLGTVSIGSNKIILTASSENTLYFSQLLNVTDKILDKIMTFSVLLANGSIYYATGTIREGIHITNISSGWISCYIINTRPGILFTAGKGLVLEPVAAKLEPGNRFTGWPAWDYGTELRKCQRYLLGIRPDNYKERIIPIGQGVATTNGKVRVLIPTPVSMRTRPVFNVGINNLRIVSTTPDVENGIIPDTVNNMFYSNGLIFIDVYAKGLTAGNAYELYLFGTTTETMLFSAEL